MLCVHLLQKDVIPIVIIKIEPFNNFTMVNADAT